MTGLKFYARERELFPDEHKLMIDSQHHVKLIVGKLCRHYDLPIPDLIFTGRTKGTYFQAWGRGRPTIRFPKKVSILLLCHEVAHHYNLVKKGSYNHTKKLMTTIKRLLAYCRKKDYWGWAKMDKQKHIDNLKTRMAEVLAEKNALMNETFPLLPTQEELEKVQALEARYNALAETKGFIEASMVEKPEPWEPDKIY